MLLFFHVTDITGLGSYRGAGMLVLVMPRDWTASKLDSQQGHTPHLLK